MRQFWKLGEFCEMADFCGMGDFCEMGDFFKMGDFWQNDTRLFVQQIETILTIGKKWKFAW